MGGNLANQHESSLPPPIAQFLFLIYEVRVFSLASGPFTKASYFNFKDHYQTSSGWLSAITFYINQPILLLLYIHSKKVISLALSVSRGKTPDICCLQTVRPIEFSLNWGCLTYIPIIYSYYSPHCILYRPYLSLSRTGFK